MCRTPEAHRRRIASGQTACLAVGIGIYTVIFTILAVLRYRAFYSYEWTDLAGINQVIWSTAHGGWFFQSVTGQYFMGHFQPVLALLCVPYFVVPRVTTLFFLIALAVGLGAVPVFLIARRVLSPRAGILWAWTYLLYSPLHNVTLTDFRPVVFCIPCLLAALYVFERKRFGWFCAWSVAAVFCQENIGLCVAFLGLYALWRRRSLKWVLTPILLGTLWFALCTRVLMPMFFGDVMYPFGGYLFLWIGDKGAGALVAKILKNPLQFAALALSSSRVQLLIKCFWPLCFLPFVSPIVMLVPAASWFQLLMVQHSALHAVRIHWLAPMIPVFFFAAIMGSRRLLWLTRRLKWARSMRARASAALIAAPLVASALSNLGPNSLAQTSGSRPTHNPRVAYVTSLYDPVLYTMEDEDRVAWRALAAVPPDASVAASADLMPALSHRKILYELGFRLRYRDGRERNYLDVDYVVIHARCESFSAGVYDWPGIVRLRERTLKMLEGRTWEPVFMEGNFLVLRRLPPSKLARPLPQEAIAHVKRHWSDERAQSRPGGRSDLARTAYELGDQEKAIERYAALAAISPYDPYPCRKAGEALRELGRLDESLSYLRMASDRSPLCFTTCMAHAKALLGARRIEAAEREYRRAIRLLPTHEEPYVGLGMAHMAKRDMKAAAGAFRRAVRLDPSYRAARQFWERCR